MEECTNLGIRVNIKLWKESKKEKNDFWHSKLSWHLVKGLKTTFSEALVA